MHQILVIVDFSVVINGSADGVDEAWYSGIRGAAQTRSSALLVKTVVMLIKILLFSHRSQKIDDSAGHVDASA